MYPRAHQRRFQPRKWERYLDPVTRIWKSLYGFGRANYDWRKHADAIFLASNYFRIEDSEGTMFARRISVTIVVVVSLYVDDLIINGQSEAVYTELRRLGNKLPIKDGAGPIEKYFSMTFRLFSSPGRKGKKLGT